jgi:predicted GNAT family N-acyltransferase
MEIRDVYIYRQETEARRVALQRAMGSHDHQGARRRIGRVLVAAGTRISGDGARQPVRHYA